MLQEMADYMHDRLSSRQSLCMSKASACWPSTLLERQYPWYWTSALAIFSGSYAHESFHLLHAVVICISTGLTLSCSFVEYADRVPQDKARFMQQLETFYAESNALLHNPQVSVEILTSLPVGQSSQIPITGLIHITRASCSLDSPPKRIHNHCRVMGDCSELSWVSHFCTGRRQEGGPAESLPGCG